MSEVAANIPNHPQHPQSCSRIATKMLQIAQLVERICVFIFNVYRSHFCTHISQLQHCYSSAYLQGIIVHSMYILHCTPVYCPDAQHWHLTFIESCEQYTHPNIRSICYMLHATGLAIFLELLYFALTARFKLNPLSILSKIFYKIYF